MLTEIINSSYLLSPEQIVTIISTLITAIGAPRLIKLIMAKIKLKSKEKTEALKYNTEANKKYESHLNKTLDEHKKENERLQNIIKDMEVEKNSMLVEMSELKVRIAVLTERLSNYVLHSRGDKSKLK